ncbi:hypothetical protein PAPHI01_1185 [Pancytospora philotis]|nr:hypothetical protein PAPHI01_1185 [Pancytospora philotis]
MNKESFEKLPKEKKEMIEQAYYAAYKKEISPGEFFTICRSTLTDAEYSSLFSERAKSVASQTTAAMAGMGARLGDLDAPEHTPGFQGGPKDLVREEIKTENIEDIMQYSGIDLKEEADNITKEVEHSVSMGMYDEGDAANQPDSLFNAALFKEFLVKLCVARGVKINEDGVTTLFQAVKRKLLDFVDKMDSACKIRSEAQLADYSFHIDNEVSKQLWYLNELEKAKMDKLMIKRDEDQKKKKIIQEREDLLIKKRQSNTVAMAAMGLKQRSWMNLDPSKSGDDNGKFSSIYAPFDEKAFDEKIKDRVITMKDFIYVLEKDKRYNKSIFLIQYYFR